MTVQKPAERALLKKDLQLKLELIREKEAALPDMIAEVVPTKPYRDKVRHFMVVLEKYIAGLDTDTTGKVTTSQDDSNGEDSLCVERYGEGTEEAEICGLLDNYGVDIDPDAAFTVDRMRLILQSVELTAQRLRSLLVDCYERVGEETPANLTEQDIFRAVFAHVQFKYTNRNGGLTDTPLDRSTSTIELGENLVFGTPKESIMMKPPRALSFTR